jgi:hypothetical protein
VENERFYGKVVDFGFCFAYNRRGVSRGFILRTLPNLCNFKQLSTTYRIIMTKYLSIGVSHLYLERITIIAKVDNNYLQSLKYCSYVNGINILGLF